ncbi:hypothetical protein DEAC_c31570 [Desulfosporosinus acididurans]|uniref:Uncharacterized protein n=1 Tax=Desulfosporosinus acididurans TaxID=476652 RepID=A0A0J1FMV4_9FIRM|nr:hypothetical protein [Desulfosporosinus acididurans]KLU64829.1 hypothetical protein DEAC_c31570 [Desulfosporosinus acididurans]
MTIDSSIFDKRIIIKVMTKDGFERITSANDIYNGGVDESEYLIDPTQYDDETSYEMEKYWSEKLGIPVLGDDEEIDFFINTQGLKVGKVKEKKRMLSI